MVRVVKTLLLHKYILSLLLACLLITITFFVIVKNYEEQEIYSNFKNHIQKYVMAIDKEVSLNVEVIHSLKSLFNILPEVSREMFHDFTKPFLKTHPSIQSLAWVPKIKKQERKAYEEKARIDYPWFDITNKTHGQISKVAEKKVYFPVYYLEPYKGNELALGYDMSSDKERLEVLMRAAETDAEWATGKIILLQDNRRQASFLIVSPLFNHADVSNIKGFIVGAFKVNNIVASALQPFYKEGSYFTIIDVKKNEELLYESRKYDYQLGQSYEEKFDMWGREWKLIAQQYEHSFVQHHKFSMLILFLGLLGTILLIYGYYHHQKNNP